MNNTSIASMYRSGVALAAIKAFYAELECTKCELDHAKIQLAHRGNEIEKHEQRLSNA